MTNKITHKSLLNYMEKIRHAYLQEQVKVDLAHLNKLINDMKEAAAQTKSNNNNEILRSIVTMLENALQEERVKYCNGYLLDINSHTDSQFTHYINMCENNHYPRLLGLALKYVYESNQITPNKKLIKIVSGIEPIFYQHYHLLDKT